jgi:prepilin-type N-terminal cleavage/methylation domain-containing protein
MGSKNAGFTLVELMVVVIVVTSLTVMALVSYTKTLNRGYADTAMQQAILIHGAQDAYHAKNGVYWPQSATPVTDVTQINTNLQLSLTTDKYNYSCTGNANGSTWSCTTTYKNSPNFIITVNQFPLTAFLGTHAVVEAGTANPACTANCP